MDLPWLRSGLGEDSLGALFGRLFLWLEVFDPEQHASVIRIEHAGGEAEFTVGILRNVVALQHFEGDLAATTLAANFLDLEQHFLAQAKTAKFAHHRHIVDVDQRFAGKRRKPFKSSSPTPPAHHRQTPAR